MSAPAEQNLSASDYVTCVLQRYRRLPGTAGHIRAADRRLARQLRDDGVPLALVEAAFALAVCRRVYREGSPLPPIRSLHYFLPVIRELELEQLSPSYLLHLNAKLVRITTASK